MKKILFCLFGIMLSLDALSQNVCIELSVHWQLEKDIFKEDSIVNTPFLHITYKNNSNENIYFKKLPLPDSLGLPTPGWLAEYYYLPSEDTINWLTHMLPPTRTNWSSLPPTAKTAIRLHHSYSPRNL